MPESFYRRVQPQALKNPYLVAFSPAMAEILGIEPEDFRNSQLIEVLSGNRVPGNSDPIAMLYAGHQFGVFVPQLGDGRALMLGEIEDWDGMPWEVQLKGAGLTPFSRMGDGRAVLRSTIREFLGSEALAALDVPTTRALCITGSPDPVYREKVETAAVLTRVAPSHLRFGNFEVFFYRGQYDELGLLADFIIDQFYPELKTAENPYLELLREVSRRTAKLIAHWQCIGFTHGVLNSDNMSILGLTIDYGPFGFLDRFRSGFVCNHTDEQGRYAYDQQPRIGLFNLSCLAQAMLPLFDNEDGNRAAEMAKAVLAEYQPTFVANYYAGMAAKLGFRNFQRGDEDLYHDLFALMEGQVDFTNFFRALCDFRISDVESGLRDRFVDREGFDRWAQRYRDRLQQDGRSDKARQKQMRGVNPRYILRNYLVQQAIENAEQGDFSEVENLLRLLQKPFAQQNSKFQYAADAPDWADGLELSCSS